MGCDGGTIPRRDELVRRKKKPEQKDKDAELAFKWKHCTIQQLPLQSPIVSCGLGKLYSKEAVIEGLLDRTTLPESAVHIKTLRDIKTLNLTANSAYDDNSIEKGDSYSQVTKSPYICPVIGLEMNGKYKFCYFWTCGCVMSERALKQVKTSICHRCQTPFETSDIVIINAEGDDLDLMTGNMLLRRASKKNGKKSSKNRGNVEVAVAKQVESTTEVKETTDKGVDVHKNDEASTSSTKSSKKRQKNEDKGQGNSGGVNSRKSRQLEPEDPAFKKVKSNYSIANDPQASEVLKSIFTSHKSATSQTRAHWVTYNPFYN